MFCRQLNRFLLWSGILQCTCSAATGGTAPKPAANVVTGQSVRYHSTKLPGDVQITLAGEQEIKLTDVFLPGTLSIIRADQKQTTDVHVVDSDIGKIVFAGDKQGSIPGVEKEKLGTVFYTRSTVMSVENGGLQEFPVQVASYSPPAKPRSKPNKKSRAQQKKRRFTRLSS